MKTWFVTGANRGLGLEVARAALEAGDRVVATARDPGHIKDVLAGHGNRVQASALDVTDAASIETVVKDAAQRFGSIDVLVNNAGYGQLGAFEEVAPDLLLRQFATNVSGVFDVTRAVLPFMRAQRAGHIITISSIAGLEGFDGSSVNCATKHAVSGWSEALAKMVARFGIKVTCVYPGRFRTDFLDGSSLHYGQITVDDYAKTSLAKRQDLDANNHLQLGDPVRFAAAMLALVAAEAPPVWFGAGSDAYTTVLNKAETLRQNAETWKSLTLSTDFNRSAWRPSADPRAAYLLLYFAHT